MKQTAIQVLIERMKFQLKNEKMEAYHAGLRMSIKLAEELGAMERQQIVDAYVESSKDNSSYDILPQEDFMIEKHEAEQYFTETYG
jgi:hypothetical protein